MHIAGILPEDAPDPRLEQEARLKDMPIPVIELVPQPAVEVVGFGITTTTASLGGGSNVTEMTVSMSATLWRNPSDKSAPENLAVLDEATRHAIEDVPPWPRPAWLVESVERMRYPLLWEAVRTSWHRDENERTTVDSLLVQHTNYILMNQFREQLGIDIHDWSSPALTSQRVVRTGIDVQFDGNALRGSEIDTDPFVYAVGAKLPGGGTLTAVIPREHLPHLRLAFTPRPT